MRYQQEIVGTTFLARPVVEKSKVLQQEFVGDIGTLAPVVKVVM